MKICLLSAFFLFEILSTRAQDMTRSQYDSIGRCIKEGTKDTTPIYGLLRMAEYQIAKPGEFQPDLDSGEAFIHQARSINAVLRNREAEGYIALVESLRLREEPNGKEEGKKANQQAIDLLRQYGRPLLLGKALSSLSWYEEFRKADELNYRITLVANAAACFQKAGATMLQAQSLEQLADLYNILGDRLKSRVNGLEAVVLYKKVGFTRLQQVYILISDSYSLDYASSLKYGLLALDCLKQSNDSSQQFCQTNNLVGLLFNRMHEYEKALPYFEAGLSWAIRRDQQEDIYILQRNIQVPLLRSGQSKRLIDIASLLEKKYGIPQQPRLAIPFTINCMLSYCVNGRNDVANVWCSRLRKLRPEDFSDSLKKALAIMQFYWKSSQYALAPAYVKEVRTLLKQVTDSSVLSDCYRYIFYVDTGRHEYAQAVQDLSFVQRLNDSLFNRDKMGQIQQLQIEYATAEKETRIKLLQKETEIQKKDITHSNQTRDFAIVGAVLLLGVGFGRYRLKQRQNRQLEAKQKEITVKNGQLEKLLKENEWLLREVHHRVKNNLQVVTNLLSSQSVRLREEAAINAVLDSQHRVQSIALIHQKLYKGDNFSDVNMQDYIADLVYYLRDTVKSGQQIIFESQVEAISLNVTQAVPIGLILNETITNSIKYAFADGTSGVVSIKFAYQTDKLLMLRVSDDGVGLADDLSNAKSWGFGTRLIRGLAEDLEASVELSTEGGTSWTFVFAKLQPESSFHGLTML